jgi:hypothetical protein
MATDTKPIADRYRIFAHFEAKGRSAAYEALAGFFADSELCLHYVSQFPSFWHTHIPTATTSSG